MKSQNSQSTGVSTFASRTSPSTDQSLQKSFHLSYPDKIELKKISFPSENKKYSTAQSDTTKAEKRSIDNGLKRRWTNTTGYNSTLPKVAVSYFVGQFCVYLKGSSPNESYCVKSPPSASCETLAPIKNEIIATL